MVQTPLTRRVLLMGALVVAVPARADTWMSFGDGLTALVPAGHTAILQGAALHVTQSEAVRSPLTLILRTDADFALHRQWFPNRRGDIRYTIQAMGGEGSGGPIHELRAIRSFGIPLVLIAHRHAEIRPDFEMAFNLLSSVHRQS